MCHLFNYDTQASNKVEEEVQDEDECDRLTLTTPPDMTILIISALRRILPARS